MANYTLLDSSIRSTIRDLVDTGGQIGLEKSLQKIYKPHALHKSFEQSMFEMKEILEYMLDRDNNESFKSMAIFQSAILSNDQETLKAGNESLYGHVYRLTETVFPAIYNCSPFIYSSISNNPIDTMLTQWKMSINVIERQHSISESSISELNQAYTTFEEKTRNAFIRAKEESQLEDILVQGGEMIRTLKRAVAREPSTGQIVISSNQVEKIRELIEKYPENPLVNMDKNYNLANLFDEENLKSLIKEVLGYKREIYDTMIKVFEDNNVDFKKMINLRYEQLDMKGNESSQFLLKKELEGYIDKRITLESKNYTEMLFLVDRTVAFKKKNGEFKAVTNCIDMVDIMREVCADDISYRLNKNPQLKKAFIERLEDENFKCYHGAVKVIETYKSNENAIKEFFKTEERSLFQMLKRKSFEGIDDYLNEGIKEIKIKQYAHSITSSKYRELYDKKSYSLFREMYEAGLKEDFIQKYIGKKLASFKDSESFNKGLEQVLEIANNFTYEAVAQKVSDVGASIVFERDNQLVIRVDTHDQCKALGSTSWCIVRDEYYFDSYTHYNSSQYILYDFNKLSRENDSMIGFTIDSRGTISAMHLKDDAAMKREDFSNDVHYSVVAKDIERYDNMADTFKSLLKHNGYIPSEKTLHKLKQG